jgi:hypothetical protein
MDEQRRIQRRYEQECVEIRVVLAVIYTLVLIVIFGTSFIA